MEANPAVQTELRNTLQAAFPGPAVPSAKDIVLADIPYLDGACEEAFRLGGVAKASLRRALADTEILGCKVPKGAEVFMNLHVNRLQPTTDDFKRSATSEEHKGGSKAERDIGSFEPRRWLVTDGTGKTSFNGNAIPSLAFGGGYRGCLGESCLIALVEMTPLTLAPFGFISHTASV